MTTREKNKLSMFLKVKSFFHENISQYPSLTSITNLVNTFNANLEQLFVLEAIASSNSKAYAAEKNKYRLQLQTQTVSVGGALMSFAQTYNDDAIKIVADISPAQKSYMNDPDLELKAMRLLEIVNENTIRFAPYGLTTDFIATYRQVFEQFKISSQQLEVHQRNKVNATQEVKHLLQQNNELLLQKIDPLLATTALSHRVLYDQYLNTRLIDDHAASHSQPDYTLTIPPNTLILAATLPYDSKRRFKIRNTGKVSIQWGLSTLKDSFSNGFAVLEAGKTSEKLSKTLGEEGDFLVVGNVGEVEGSVNVWIEG